MSGVTMIPGLGITTRWVRIDRDFAKVCMALNTSNRHLRENLVAKYAGEMNRGQWAITHQGVAFRETNELDDGQHRLQAIIEADGDGGYWMLVTEGLPEGSQTAMDSGLKRQAFDFIEGSHKTIKAASARMLLGVQFAKEAGQDRLDSGELQGFVKMVTNYDIWDFAHMDPMVETLNEFAPLASKAASKFEAATGTALLAAGALYPDDGGWFEGLQSLITGTGFDVEGDPLVALWKSTRKSTNQHRVFLRTLKAARARERGEKLSMLKFAANESVLIK